jgi:hypothetical protein
MRILGFTKKWPKLQQDEFTTFRYPRKDSDKGRDWHLGEELQIVFQPRHQNEYLGIVRVISKQPKEVQRITDEEAIADGFEDLPAMMEFLNPAYSFTVVNKLTLRWIERAQEVKHGI